MGTHPIEKIKLDYENDRMTPDMTIGHILQHIEKLYQSQPVANVNHYELQGKVDTLEKTIKALQNSVTCLTKQLEQMRPKRNNQSFSQPSSPP